MEVNRILFTIDFTWSIEHAETMVALARGLAEKFDAHLVTLFVVGDLKFYARISVPRSSLSVLRDEIMVEAEKSMARFQDEYFEGASNVSFKIRVGDPVEEIINAAKEEDAGLVVMGTHGRKGLEHALMGSVTELVIRSCEVPVITLRLE